MHISPSPAAQGWGGGGNTWGQVYKTKGHELFPPGHLTQAFPVLIFREGGMGAAQGLKQPVSSHWALNRQDCSSQSRRRREEMQRRGEG